MRRTFEAADNITKSQDELLGEIGQLNLQLLERVREGHIQPQMKILEICCGYGNNIRFFIKHGYNSFGTDPSDEAIQLIREYLPGWNPALKIENFQVADPLDLPFEDDFFDYAYSLHFSEYNKKPDFLVEVIEEALRVLKSSGILFLQLETSIGLNGKVLHLIGNRYLMQDGQEKILISETELTDLLNQLNCKILPPLSTLMFHSKKSLTFLSLIKN